jgi:rSAM/selenodomain-associated transferase 2
MLSIVIPTLNAAETLPGTLRSIRQADEVVVVDGGSTDATAAVAEREGARVIRAARGRGRQLHSGAGAAAGDWLLFLHADTRLERGWREAVNGHSARQPEKAACFRLKLEAQEWQARVVEAAVRARVRLLGLPYGDQGLLVPRPLYEALGGYRPLPLMEDVDFARRLGRSRIAPLEVAALTSAERWRRDGWLRRSGRNLACLALWRAGMSAERIARLYG